MTEKSYPRLSAVFRFILKCRFWIVAFYALLLPPSVYFAVKKVKQDNSPERLMVQSDEEYKTQKAFEQVFGKEDLVLLFFDTKTLWTSEVLERIWQAEKQIQTISGVQTNSLFSSFEASPNEENKKISFSDSTTLQNFQKFALLVENNIFIRQGLIDEQGKTLGIRLILQPKNTEDLHQILQKIDQILQNAKKTPSPFLDIRKVGQPYVNDYLDQDTRSAGVKYFALFGIFVVGLTLFLYRSIRALIAIMIPLGVSTALTVGFVGVIGGVFTIVSSLIPMTILITATATLVYIHSRFVEQPPERSVEEHQIFSLSNKFLACTASIFATAVGFAALVVSKIKPIREMGIWVAVGLVFTWLVTFTLFPALQKILQTPTQQKRKVAGQWFLRVANFLPGWTYRYRFFLVAAALLWSFGGGIALFGFRSSVHSRYTIRKMNLETNSIEYINHNSKLYKDIKQLEEGPKGGLALTELWLKQDKVSEPEDNKVLLFDADMIFALQDLQKRLEADSAISMAFGFPDLLELFYTIGSQGKPLPRPQENLEQAQEKLNQILTGFNMILNSKEDSRKGQLEKALQSFVKFQSNAQIRITVRSKTLRYEDMLLLHQRIKDIFAQIQKKYPEKFQEFKLTLAGSGVLQAKVSHHLVPTLTESFGITVAIIFLTFLLVFRSGAARIMAMIPSLFAILAMFSLMRLTGMSLNIATILIASTVLGSSENDQIHFFYHYQERKKAGGTTEESLKHTLLLAGRAIFFATLINAGGFLAFALADLPPIRQFGILSSLAFVLSMIADFTALPAALWIVFRAKPDQKKMEWS